MKPASPEPANVTNEDLPGILADVGLVLLIGAFLCFIAWLISGWNPLGYASAVLVPLAVFVVWQWEARKLLRQLLRRPLRR